MESENLKLAIEIDGETYHNPNKVSSNKYYDDLTKQNSLIYQNWKVYRWVYNQLKLDFPVDVADYELIDLFNWQDEVKDMTSQLEFVRMVDVQTETIERYIRDGKIAADLEVPYGDKRSFKYFKEATIENYAKITVPSF